MDEITICIKGEIETIIISNSLSNLENINFNSRNLIFFKNTANKLK